MPPFTSSYTRSTRLLPNPSLVRRSIMTNELASQVDFTNRALRRSSRFITNSHVEATTSVAPSGSGRVAKRKHIATEVSVVDESSGSEGIAVPDGTEDSGTVKKKRTRKNKVKDKDDEDFDASIPKAKRTRPRKPEPVYVIPEVEQKETTFRGRLGYACLNTVLRNKKPATESVFCSRTCRLDSLKKKGIEWVKDLGRKNVEDLMTVIQWNEDNNIGFFRLSSEMFPYASHGVHGYSLDYCAPLLAKAGALANKYGHRLTTHPGQYTQLGSPKPAVVEAAVRELKYHAQMLDLLNIGPDGVMIVHGGGVYDDKETTLTRLKKSIQNLPKNVRARLVLENDEMCYNAEDLLPVCEELEVPLVFDYHHDTLFPSSIPPKEIIQRANAIWKRRGIKPKQHLSEQRPGAVTIMERRAHADRCENLPADLPDDMDLMIEAKDKEQAVLYLHRMYGLQEVNHESLRPANPNPSTQTNGRKSNKRARAKAAKGNAPPDDTQDDEESDDSTLSPCPSEDEQVVVEDRP